METSNAKTSELNENNADNFWGITVLFNPSNFKNKYSNYKIFRENSKRQGLKLLAVELAFDDSPFELKEEDAEKIIQIRGGKKNILWQKEALLNIALKNLPEECTKFAWIDSDIIFEEDDWIKKTSELLDKYKIVQPFLWAMFIKKEKSIQGVDIKNIKSGDISKSKRYSFAYSMNVLNNMTGHPGFVWAARKDVFKEIGFYDCNILGASDNIMAVSFFSSTFPLSISNGRWYSSDALSKYLTSWWKKSFETIKGSVYYCDTNIYHLWHGEKKDRFYAERRKVLKRYDFDPSKDIKKNELGILEWGNVNKNFVRDVRWYFYSRKEERKFNAKNLFFNCFYQLNYGKRILFFKIIGLFGLVLKRLMPKLYMHLVSIKPDFLIQEEEF